YHLLVHFFSGGGKYHYGYESSLFRGLLACLTAFALVWWLGPRVIRLLIRLRVGDVPDFDRVDYNEMTRHKANVPTMGGVLILVAVLAGVLLFADLRNFYVSLALLCLIWLGGLGFVDDYLKLTAARRGGGRDGLKLYQKLLFQLGLGVLLASFIYRHGSVGRAAGGISFFDVLNLPFVRFDPTNHITLSLGVFLIAGVIVISFTSNAVNLTDGLDGLAAGCLVVSSIVFMVLSEIAGDNEWASYLLMPPIPGAGELAVVCGAMTGACLGFLWYNCHPAQMFMGDTGSLPLGGLIGYVAIVIRQELMLVIVGGVFVIEALSVILQVGFYKRTGRRLFRMAPIHHHFHLAGWRESQVVSRFWLLAVLFAILALVTTKLR
ncbi:MAG: phospho-N-acetylmuramoyl-pentapeptide-transferase, partial [Phycisphaerae bacterium]